GEADRGILAPNPGRGWRLAAVPRRGVQHLGQREGVFRAEGDRRRPAGAPYAPGAGGGPGGRRGRTHERVQAGAGGGVRRGAVAGGAGDAAGNHAPAAVVPVPSVEGLILVADGDRAAA